MQSTTPGGKHLQGLNVGTSLSKARLVWHRHELRQRKARVLLHLAAARQPPIVAWHPRSQRETCCAAELGEHQRLQLARWPARRTTRTLGMHTSALVGSQRGWSSTTYQQWSRRQPPVPHEGMTCRPSLARAPFQHEMESGALIGEPLIKETTYSKRQSVLLCRLLCQSRCDEGRIQSPADPLDGRYHPREIPMTHVRSNSCVVTHPCHHMAYTRFCAAPLASMSHARSSATGRLALCAHSDCDLRASCTHNLICATSTYLLSMSWMLCACRVLRS